MFRLFSRHWSLPAAICLVVETGLLVFSVWVGYRVRFWSDFGEVYFYEDFALRAVTFALVVLVSLYFNSMYDFGERLDTQRFGSRLLRSFVLAFLALVVIYYLTYPALTTGRTVLAVSLIVSAVLLALWRACIRWGLRKSLFSERVLIVGTDESAIEIARELLERRHLGYRVLGFLDDDPALQGKVILNPAVIGTTSEVCQVARERQASRVIVAKKDKRGKLDMDRLLECKTSGVPVSESMDYYERLTGRIPLEGLRKSWLIFSQGFVVSPSAMFQKRVLDLAVAVVGLIVAAPLMLLIALAVRLESRGPALYRQERVGRKGRIFTLWKFRSMQANAEEESGPRWAEKDDPRITRVGRLLRATRLDEMPQLWNVLVGDMSLVGPRPEREPFVRQLIATNPIYEQRLVVRPGLTGWAQIRDRYAATLEESLRKLEYDLYYIKNLSVFLDLSVLASTLRIVLLNRGAR